MALNINPVTNHREREKGVIVYSVYSRRSAGLSIGINLFPDKKSCQFNCPYCEVFPFLNNAGFSLEQMEADLRFAIESAQEQNVAIKDICFSGNGEPTLSVAFADAFKLAEKIIASYFECNDLYAPNLVVITNGTGLLHPQVFSFLKDAAAANPSFNIWLKLDAGTPEWYQKMNRSVCSCEKLIEKIKEFVSCAPVTLQTMLCAIDGEPPPQEEAQAWEKLVCELTANSVNTPYGKRSNVRKVQLYGKARSAPEDPLASELPAEYLEERAVSLHSAFARESISTPVEIYI